MKALIEPSGRIAQIEAGAFPVAPPLRWVECDEGITTRHRYEGGVFVAPPAARAATLAEQRAEVDAAAERARRRYVQHPLQVAEYEQAEREAAAYAARDYTGDVPLSVETWATAKGWLARQAADDILTAAGQLRWKLMQIRAVRLAGKEAVAAGSKTVDEVLAELAGL